MAQVLKYQAGGTAPKPIKVGNSYYTADQLKKELYGSKLDDYIKFQDFDSKRAQTFRKNLENQVDAIIDGSLRLEGNSLVDSGGRWKNNGEYAKAKLFGKLNEDQKQNNESLDVANYLIRALNSGKISTYSAPDEYDITTALKGFDIIKDDDDWKKLDTKDRMSQIAKGFTDEATKLGNDQSYKDKYSYEGWQNTEWDKRANATIEKLNKIAGILSNPNLTDLQKKIELGKLNIDLTDYLTQKEQEEQEKQEEPKKETQGKQSEFEIVNKGIFDFTAPKFKYKGKEYTYGTDEANKILNQTITGSDGKPITIGAYLEQEKQKYNTSLINRNHIDFATVPSQYKYFSNVTDNFVKGSARGAKDVRAAYILRKDPLDPTGSIIKVIYKGSDGSDRGNTGYYRYDQGKLIPVGVNTDNGDVYDLKNAKPVNLSALDSIQAKLNAEDQGNYTTDLIFGGGDYNVNNLDKFISNENYIRQLNSGTLRLRSYINSLRKALQKTADSKKRRAGVTKDAGGKDAYYIDIIGTNDNRPLRIYFKSKQYRDQALKDNDFDAARVRAVNLPVKSKNLINTESPYDYAGQEISYKFPTLKKEGGILFAQMGVQLDDSPVKVSEVKVKPEKKSKKLNGREMTLSATNNYNKELEAGVDFDSGEARRLAYSLIDLGSAVASLIPGASLASTAVGVGMTAATAGEDFADAFKGKMSFGDATWNAVSSLGLDAMSIIPGLKAAKIGKNLKFVLKAIPRLIGYAQAANMLRPESAAAIGKTMGKISSGNFDQLTTQDFTNITHAIRIATMIGRDTKGTFRKGRNMLGKKTEQVEISGKVNGQEIKTTVNKEDITTSKFKVKRIDQDKVKQKLAEEANRRDDITKKPLIQEKDAEGKLLTNEDGTPKMKQPLFEVGDVKSTNTSTIRDHNLYESEVGHPKKLFEGWLGYKGYNSPFSDAYIAQRWDPILKLNGQTTNKQARKIAQEDAKLPVSAELKQKVDQMVAEKMISRKQADEILEGYSRKQFIEQEAQKVGVTPAEYVRDSHNRDIEGFTQQQNKFVSEQSAQKLAELNKKYESISKRRANKQAKIDEAARIKQEELDKIARIRRERAERQAAKKAAAQQKLEAEKLAARQKAQAQSQKRKELRDLKKYAETILGKDKALSDKFNNLTPRQQSKVIRSAHNIAEQGGKNNYDTNFLNSLQWTFNPSNPKHLQQGGSLDRGFALINAYKSGGYMIPKFQNSGQLKLNYSYDPNKYYTDDIANANTTTIKNLGKVFIKKGTPSQKGKNQKLAANDITAKDITYQTGIDYFRKYVENGEWVQAVQDYLKTHGAGVYNTNISKLRELRSKFENSEYTNIKNDDVREFNKLFNSIFGKSYGEYSIDLQDIYGGATNLRHILSFLNLTDQKERRQFKINDIDYWLDNAGYARTGKYGEQYVAPAQNSGTSVIPTDRTPAGTQTGGTSGTGGGSNPDEGKKKTDATRQDTSDMTKPVTKPNPIQALRMSELAGALATNAKATNELLKYRAPTIDAPYKLAYLAGKYPVIAATQNQVGKVNTMASTPVTSDVGTYLSNTQSAYSKGLTAMQNAYSENYNAYLASKDKVAEAGNYNNAASIQANNENVTKYVTAENMKNKVRADLYSSNFSQAIKPYLSETRTWLQEAETNKLKAKYEVENQIAKEDYANEIRVLNEETVANILSDEGNKTKFEKDASGNRRSNEAIIQLYYADHPDKANEYQQRRFDATQKYSKKLIENSTLMSPNFKWLTTTKEKYDFKKQGGSLTPNDRIKLQKIKDYNAARRQDSKESIKSITKDKEEFGKNYRAMSAGTLKMLERTLK